MPANAQRGEVELEVNGKLYTLRLSTNAAAQLETRLKKKVGEILRDATQLSMTDVRTLMWLLLQKHHGPEFKTHEQAGDLIDECGGASELFTKLAELIDVNKPSATNGDAGNPPAAQPSGTGDNSTLTPVVSV